ncbi:hypothetical protein FACS1894169_11880 [Bacteroidia bacterium]|nr:hypothetical protein FACS1894169_11880 [Bacteroidia bacterium]
MKWILAIALLILISSSCNRNKQGNLVENNVAEIDTISASSDSEYNYDSLYVIENVKCPNVFKRDSGFLRKKEALEILRIASPSLYDSIPFQEELKDILERSYMGKYYKEKEQNKYILYIEYLSSSNYIFEIYPDLNIIKYRDFASGNYNCCSSNFDGFKKAGKFYSIRYCGTGSGYCAGHVYIFKDLDNVPENSIIEQCFMFNPIKNIHISLSSSVNNITNTSIRFSYEYKEEDADSEKVLLTKHIDVEYNLVGNKWVAKDNIDIQEMFGLY